LLVESVRRGQALLPRVEVVEADFQRHSQAFLDFAVEADNKGMEGLTCQPGRETHRSPSAKATDAAAVAKASGLAAGDCNCSGLGSTAASTSRPLRLPSRVPFIDYGSLAVHGDRIAVLSQQSSALWVGAFRPGSWEFADEGICYQLPRDAAGRIQYGTAEGVSWLADDRVAIVSDRAPRSAPRWRSKHRSVHIFALP
jgi:hypothetical protein